MASDDWPAEELHEMLVELGKLVASRIPASRGQTPGSPVSQVSGSAASTSSSQSASNGAPQRTVVTTSDMSSLAAKQHPGEKWGYLDLRAVDQTAPLILVKVPDAAADGALQLPLSGDRHGPGSTDFYREIKGFLRRGQGKDHTDLFEATAIRHIGDPNMPSNVPTVVWRRVAGWIPITEEVALIH